ncbi:MAG: type II secretion system GspH family protein [Puniceicoccales bacterium]|jgi:prepilin-type N-terminal cleavage/methylation domain-containing protein|nr:type II secretion system GspH family protein [Puniceicoccales bacterium]
MNILNKRNRGFTLVEILIVLIILAGIITMLTKGTMSGRKAALANQTKIDMQGRVKSAVIAKVALLGQMPQTTDLTEAGLGFQKDELKDPFKEAYTFKIEGNTVTIEAGTTATKLGTPAVNVDCTPFLP